MSAQPRESQPRRIYLKAVQISDAQERRVYLDESCGEDASLRERVEKLLSAREQSGVNLLQQAVSGREAAARQTDENEFAETQKYDPEAMGLEPGRVFASPSGGIDVSGHPMIGPYKLLQEIGQGGMGTVYMAQQTEPVKRKVALKIIKPGMDSKDVLARFEAERQALAMMDHPSIAKVLDGGTTDTGRPYFVMDLVHGTPITTFCKEARLSTRQRLELFVDVCRAVQHAHLKGVIHRDLKPSNVLVTMNDDKPLPKVIDFGVSKALANPLTDKTLFTAYGQMVGTPLYMSPEQAQFSAQDVDIRSDVYSLGVVLYELLTGSTPFDKDTLKKSGFDEMRRMIREVDPPRPSARVSTLKAGELSTLSGNRQIDAKKFSQSLKGELDWIVMKALEKDRERRYESANALAADVQRCLNDERVEACPPSAGYRLRKYAKRNKGLLTTAALLIAMLVMSTLVSAGFAFQASRAKTTAQQSERDVNDALLASRQSEAEAVKQAQIARLEAERADREAKSARAAQSREKFERLRAESARYISDTHLAASLLRNDEHADAFALLVDHVPNAQSEDHRGWEWYYLLGQSTQAFLSWQASQVNIPSIDWSPDGTKIATAHWDGPGVRIWDVQSGKAIRSLPGGTAVQYGVDWHPSGLQLAWGSAMDDCQVRIWDSEANEIQSIKTNTGSHRVLRWDPSGERIAVATYRAKSSTILVVIDRVSGKYRVAQTAELQADLNQLAWNSSGKTLFVLTNDGRVIVFDADTLQIIEMLPQKYIRSIACHPSNALIALGTRSGEILLYDTSNDKSAMSFDAHLKDVVSLAWAPNGRLLASGGADRSVAIWDTGVTAMLSRYAGHDAMTSEVTWNPESDRLASCGLDGRINIWPVKPKDRRREFENAFTPHPADRGSKEQGFTWLNNNTIRSIAGNKRITDIHIDTGRRTTLGSIEVDNGWEVRLASPGLAFAFDPRQYWKAGKIFVSNLANGMVRPFKTLGNAAVAWGSQTDSNAMVYHTTNDGRLFLTNLENGLITALGEEDHVNIRSVIWSPDNRYIAALGNGVGSDDGSPKYAGWLHLFDARTGEKLNRTRVGHRRVRARAGAWSPDGKSIVATTEDGVCQVYEVSTLTTQFARRFHSLDVHSVSWHPLEPRIASASDDGSIAIWDSDSGDVLLKLFADSAVKQVQWSPDGKMLLAGDTSGTLYLWDANPGHQYTQSDELAKRIGERLNKQSSIALRTGDFKLARDAVGKLLEMEQDPKVTLLYQAALLSLWFEDDTEYRHHCNRAASQFQNSKDLLEIDCTTSTCLLAPNSIADYASVISLIRHATVVDPDSQKYRAEFGAILMRAGKYDEAKVQLEKALVAGENDNTSPSYIRYFLAMTEHHLGNVKAAKEHLRGANESAEKELAASPAWNRKLTLELLRKEAEALIGNSQSEKN